MERKYIFAAAVFTLVWFGFTIQAVYALCRPCLSESFCFCCAGTISCTQLEGHEYNATPGSITLDFGRWCDIESINFTAIKRQASLLKFIVFESGICPCSNNTGMFTFVVRGRERCKQGMIYFKFSVTMTSFEH